MEKLRFGLSNAVPGDATSAWGARAIVTQTGDVDFLPDRQDRVGTDEIFRRLDAQFPMPELIAAIRELLASYRMNTRQGEQFALYRSDDLDVAASTNGSGGYCYIAAWTTK